MWASALATRGPTSGASSVNLPAGSAASSAICAFLVERQNLAGAGVPLKADREQAWRDFAGWRVNYDSVLLALAELMMAPPARWISDRRLANAPALFLRWRKGRKLIETHE